MEPGVELKHITFQAGGRTILKDISLSADRGCFAGVLGANGAGKTTLLKCINGIHACSGEVRVWGRNIRDCTEKEVARLVSLMNQNTNLEFDFTCRQVVEFGRYPYWKKGFWGEKGDERIVVQAMRDTGVLEFADVLVTRISGGERQRVLFAKTLAQDSRVVLLDEPTANLDLRYQRQLFQFGQRLACEGKTVLAAVHDLNIALRYCDTFFLLHEGELLAQGTAGEVMSPEHMRQAYGLNTQLYRNPVHHGLELAVLD